MRRKVPSPRAAVGAVALVLASACGGGSSDTSANTDCPVDALRDAEAPVTITMWHRQTAENEDVLEQLIAEFEASQSDVDVKLVNQSGSEMLDKYIAGLTSGDLPDVVQFGEIELQTLVDSKTTVPIQACIDADEYDTSDFVPRTLDYYTTQGVQRAMPWNVSNPVLLYNRNAFRDAGLDPATPPQTLDEVRRFAEQLKAAGYPYGIALHVEPFVMEFLYSKSGLEYVNNGNGRDERATKSLLDSEQGLEIWSWWDDMVKSGLAVNTGSQANNYDHLFAVANGNAAMTIEASGALGPAVAVLTSGEFSDVEIGVGPLPALEPGGGVHVADGSLWIPTNASPEERAAAWKLIKFLSGPAQQAELSVASAGGYPPIRESALQDPALEQLWDQQPYLRIPYEQVLSGPSTPATVGAVIGDYLGVRDVVREEMTRMLVENVSPEDALRRAQENADAVITEYNTRIAG